jgi:hypothetical protein
LEADLEAEEVVIGEDEEDFREVVAEVSFTSFSSSAFAKIGFLGAGFRIPSLLYLRIS